MGRKVRHSNPAVGDFLMKFLALPLKGAFLIEIEPRVDERGLFARTYCEGEFKAHGLPSSFVQCNTSFNANRGILRGLHYQAEPRPEAKLVRCTRGAIFDVIVDLRPDSPTYARWYGAELTADNRKALFIPVGFAHGFQTLEDNSEVFYQMSEFYDGNLARGVRWNDPSLGISWPILPPTMSDRDARYSDLT
jgi:dTDP-4-dehydrorhamnose 3,5-epimerase